MEDYSRMLFGGDAGNFFPIADTGDQDIIFYSGRLLDAIQIGKTKYGGKGPETARAKLPPDGSFILHALGAGRSSDHGTVIGYMHATIGDVTIKVGEISGICTLTLDLKVKFSGINCKHFVDAIQFDVISLG